MGEGRAWGWRERESVYEPCVFLLLVCTVAIAFTGDEFELC